MHDQITISAALSQATELLRQSSPTARLDAELLLAHRLGWPRARLLAEGRQQLPDAALVTFQNLVARRAELEPVAYIIGHREFYELDFLVDPRVLVPRPETELLVELALAFARTKNQEPRTKELYSVVRSQYSVAQSDSPHHNDRAASDSSFVIRHSSDLNQPPATSHQPPALAIADIGTGSGCIAVALAANLPQARLIAVDLSPDALAVARLNVERHRVQERVELRQGDLLAPLEDPVDLIVSNPPYTVLSAIDEGVRRHEPHLALDGGPDGLDLYRHLLEQAPQYLKPNGAMLLEIGAEQGRSVAALAQAAFPSALVTIHQDLAGLDRVVALIC